MSIVVGIAVCVALTILDLEAFGFAPGGAIALLHLLIVPCLGLAWLAWGIKSRRAKMRGLGLALLLAAIAAFVVSTNVERRKISESKAAGDALCRALESWRKTSGRYPQHLQDLVPSFLSAVPATSMGVFTSIPFDYHAESGGDDYRLGFNSTSFVHWSRGLAAAWSCDD